MLNVLDVISTGVMLPFLEVCCVPVCFELFILTLPSFSMLSRYFGCASFGTALHTPFVLRVFAVGSKLTLVALPPSVSDVVQPVGCSNDVGFDLLLDCTL